MSEQGNPIGIEFLDGTNVARRLTCKICNEVVYDVTGNVSKENIDREAARLILHFELHHDIRIDFHRCSDPNCVQKLGVK